MRWVCVGALAAAMAATGAQAQVPGAADPLSTAVFDAGKAVPTEWRSAEFGEAGQTRLKLSLAGSVRDERGLPPLSPADRADFRAEGFDVRVSRQWKNAVSIPAGDRNVEISPYAGVAYGDAGPGAEAGATLSMSDRVADRIDDLGIDDGASFGDQGRWYLFAATSGRSVGLNMLRDEDGLRQAGWSTDATSALVSDAQAGVGWRRGPLQASIAYLHREIEPQHNAIRGLENKDDDLIAFSISFKPR